MVLYQVTILSNNYKKAHTQSQPDHRGTSGDHRALKVVCVRPTSLQVKLGTKAPKSCVLLLHFPHSPFAEMKF